MDTSAAQASVAETLENSPLTLLANMKNLAITIIAVALAASLPVRAQEFAPFAPSLLNTRTIAADYHLGNNQYYCVTWLEFKDGKLANEELVLCMSGKLFVRLKPDQPVPEDILQRIDKLTPVSRRPPHPPALDAPAPVPSNLLIPVEFSWIVAVQDRNALVATPDIVLFSVAGAKMTYSYI